MFGIGMPEMLMILVVALMVVGPKRLPEMAQTIGKAMAKLRAVGNSVQQEFDREVRPMRDINPLSDDHHIQASSEPSPPAGPSQQTAPQATPQATPASAPTDPETDSDTPPSQPTRD